MHQYLPLLAENRPELDRMARSVLGHQALPFGIFVSIHINKVAIGS